MVKEGRRYGANDYRSGLDRLTKEAIASFVRAHFVAENGRTDSLEPDFCPACGSTIPLASRFCPACGQPTERNSDLKLFARQHDFAKSFEDVVMADHAEAAPAASTFGAGNVPESLKGKAAKYLSADEHAEHFQSGTYDGIAAEFGTESTGSLKEWLDSMDAPFSTTLLALIEERGYEGVEVYKRAGMSRQLFSRIRSDAGYRPAKKTVLALALALGLGAEEARDLLKRAGFALSHSDKRDLVVEYFLEHGKGDLMEVNQALYEFDLPLL